MSSVSQRNRADYLHSKYGFSLFQVPDYRPARRGEWRISTRMPSLSDGYLSGAILEERSVLTKGSKVWMSIGLLEKESHAWHVHCAKGVVVTAGLGMGMYAFAAAMKPEVEKVIVAEVSGEIIELMQESVNFADWPCRHKIKIIQVDALGPEFAEEVESITQGRAVDYLYADIWPNFPAKEAPAQTSAMALAIKPKAAGWWGQELSFADYCGRTQRPIGELSLDAYFEELGVPSPDITEGYLIFCRDLMLTYEIGPQRSLGRWLRSIFWK